MKKKKWHLADETRPTGLTVPVRGGRRGVFSFHARLRRPAPAAEGWPRRFPRRKWPSSGIPCGRADKRTGRKPRTSCRRRSVLRRPRSETKINRTNSFSIPPDTGR